MVAATAVPEVLADLLVAVDEELLVKGRVQLGGLLQLGDGLLLFVHALHEEEGVLDFQGGARGELLDAQAVHVFGMLEQELVVIRVLFHGVVSLLLLRSLLLLVLHALNDAVLVQFELAFLIRAVVLMMIHIPL